MMKEDFPMARESVFRDSKTWYSKGGDDPALISRRHVDFYRKFAGHRILDLGCATGNYCLELKRLGFDCVGADINHEYIEKARAKGVEAVVVSGALPFKDSSFDTVIISEVLEHLLDPKTVLQEAKRVTKNNVLVTVPDSSGLDLLKKMNLTYEHMLEADHQRFYSKQSLEELLKGFFPRVTVKQEGPIFAQGLFPWYARKPLSLAISLGLVKPMVYSQLFAVCRL
jgi:ubiquinone/menaquinone biosynthesis C-methylase UbiE